MANFKSGYSLTDKGKELQAKVEAGATLKLTRMVLGDGTVDTTDDYQTATALVHQKYSMIITSTTQAGAVCTLEASLSSEAVEEGFHASELGLYAQDGDTEILYLVAYDDDPSYIPGKNDGVAVECGFSIPISFSDKAAITVTIPKTQEEIVTLVQDNAAQSVDAANAAATSQRNAEDAATRAEASAKNAATSEANAKELVESKDEIMQDVERVEAVAKDFKNFSFEEATGEELVGIINKIFVTE